MLPRFCLGATALRRNILDLFGKSLELDDKGAAYSSEGVVHDIVFPRKGDTLTIPFDRHNLWIVDERLNFTELPVVGYTARWRQVGTARLDRLR